MMVMLMGIEPLGQIKAIKSLHRVWLGIAEVTRRAGSSL